MVKKDCTGERLMKIETTLDYMKEQLETNEANHKDMMNKIDKFIESADKRYANKTVEYAVYALIGLLATGVIYAMMQGVTL